VSLLLDTHVVLWWLADESELPDEIKGRLDHEPDVHVSAVTIWEVTIKQALGKITGPADLPELILGSGFRELPVGSSHAMAAGRLPPIHRDPFDRMLVAQARCEGLTLVTRDHHCQQYDVAILRA
jgi:PIN domain nuclease of toxin-antitoxin system